MSDTRNDRFPDVPALPPGGADVVAAVLARAFADHGAGNRQQAGRLYRMVLALDPANFDALHLLGVASRPDAPLQALRSILRALRLSPEQGDALQNLRNALQHTLTWAGKLYEDGRFRELCALADVLAGIDGIEWAKAAENVGRMLNNAANTALYRDGDVDLASACVEAAARFTRHPSVLNFRMLLRLNRQDYDAAWNREDWKALTVQSGHWNGDPHPGPLVLHSHNGTGDFLQFMRFIPLARARVGRVIVILRSEVITLVRHSPLLDGVALVTSDPGVSGSVHCDVFSLAFALGLRRDDIPVPTPYLMPPATLLADWRRAIRRDGRLHVGITWSSWAKPDARSVPFDLFKRLVATTDAVFVGVHANFSMEDLRGAEFPENFRFLGVSDLLTTACVLSAMDVVIAPDGGIAHLACVLGIETWVLTARNCDWRWRVEGEASEWYGNARLFRQPVQGDWEPVAARVAERLALLAQPRVAAPCH